MSVLLVILSACGGSTTTPTTTPSALTVTPQRHSSPTAISTSSTNWTTYHRDNLRTGYIASTLDPHSLTKAWGIQLDGAVYAEPLVVGTHVIVATEGDSLYALDPTTGSVQPLRLGWQRRGYAGSMGSCRLDPEALSHATAGRCVRARELGTGKRERRGHVIARTGATAR